MDYISPLTNKINIVIGVITSLLSYALGEHWYLFVMFLTLNVVDYITGCIKSAINGKINSVKGASGVLKKLGYWIMIFVAFSMSAVFIEIGKIIGVNLGITSLIGWYVLATLIINELRSIIENFVEAGYPVPTVLTKGLEVANKTLNSKMDESEESHENHTP